ncbi:hypothetical protein F0160_26965 [Paraburkholderia sp. JPY303]|nr:hypothetical protein [Paraburkholderia atlantica]
MTSTAPLFAAFSCERRRFDTLQAVAADFIRQVHFARHSKRMRALYGERRTSLQGRKERFVGAG